MNSADFQGLVHSAFYRVLRSASPPQLPVFLTMTVQATLPTGPSPTGWPDFWWESLAVEIQGAVMARKQYLLNFDKDWLKAQAGTPWLQVITALGPQLTQFP